MTEDANMFKLKWKECHSDLNFIFWEAETPEGITYTINHEGNIYTLEITNGLADDSIILAMPVQKLTSAKLIAEVYYND